ncbi:hypothetical protein Q6I02_001412 [Salmonella enterica]|nr:hypothetical protein [Salmonella enterica]
MIFSVCKKAEKTITDIGGVFPDGQDVKLEKTSIDVLKLKVSSSQNVATAVSKD